MRTGAEPPSTHTQGDAVVLDGVGFRYGPTRGRGVVDRGHAVLQGVDLRVAVGEHVAIVGRSGCGKSTLLTLIAGLAEPGQGGISVLGQTSGAGRLSCCALMPQGDSLLPWFTLRDNVAVGLRNRGVARREARAAAERILDEWNLGRWAGHRPDALSGGMRQRAAFARALVVNKPVLLADEPLGALDALTRAEMQDWLRATLPRTSATLVLVTHDVDEALLLGDRVVVLASVEDGEPATKAAEFAGWFSDHRGREQIVADPAFATARAEVLRALRSRGMDRTGVER
ncbi:ABC transporter ATP-binding protein [Tessaracoccus caeni]|uniref:ABC transporter ATP-binding protein n=1 Tax=Tessaracoccus caeni TaxID=3031239 RepID=UPI0023DC875F|nr:ABC transporter ATP-binding protein [Tessaracoccus caeni]MDF1488094.1 ABC transporter ATP-binding protein [Tessaracoccus caeni]